MTCVLFPLLALYSLVEFPPQVLAYLGNGSCQPPLQRTFRSLDWPLNVNPHLLEGFIATLILSSIIGLVDDGAPSGPENIVHFSGTNLLLFRVITHPSTDIFSIP
ncbi:hypothetical protein Tco_0071260 [Tanacetum coccineum]